METSLSLRVCNGCSSVFYKNRWMDSRSLAMVLRQVLKNHAGEGFRISKISRITDEIKAAKKGQKTVLMDITRDKKKETVEIIVSYEQCTICSRSHSGYFEGILQLRNRANSSFDDVYNFILKTISSRKDIFISKLIETKDGVDFYLSSNKFLHQFAKELHLAYGGEYKLSKRLFSRGHMSSKEIYRHTVLIRLPDFSVGDLLEIGGRLIILKRIKARTITGFDLKSASKVNMKLLKPDSIIPKNQFMQLIVSRKKPHIEVLHPRTYQSVRPQNDMDIKGEKALVAEFNEKLYLIPC